MLAAVYSTAVQCCDVLDSLVVSQTLTRRVIQQVFYKEQNSEVLVIFIGKPTRLLSFELREHVSFFYPVKRTRSKNLMISPITENNFIYSQ